MRRFAAATAAALVAAAAGCDDRDVGDRAAAASAASSGASPSDLPAVHGFSAPTVTGGMGAQSIDPAVADFNGDGFGDLAMVLRGRNQITVRFGDGRGGFREVRRVAVPALAPPPPQPCNDSFNKMLGGKGMAATGPRLLPSACVTRSDEPSGLATADLDGDGAADLVTGTSYGGSVAVLRGDGRGGFAAQVRYSTGAGSAVGQVAVADLDADGALDVVAGAGSRGVHVLLNDGQGKLRRTSALPGRGRFLLVDSEGDADTDILVQERTSSHKPRLRLFRNDGEARFDNAVLAILDPKGLSDEMGVVGMADVTGDRRPDLLVVSSKRRQLLVFAGDGRGGLAEPTVAGRSTRSAYGAAIVELTRDGLPDVVLPTAVTGKLLLLVARPGGGFDPGVAVPFGGRGYSDVTIGDADGDGRPDLWVTSHESRTISVRLALRRTGAPAG